MFVVGGESLVDLVMQPVGAEGRVLLEVFAGGSPYNCAIALGKLGNNSGFLCPVSTDRFGDMLMAPLVAAGTHLLLTDRVAAPTTLAVATLDARGKASYRFYREADRAFTRAGLIAALPEKIDVFQIGGFCPILDDDAETWLAVADAAAAKGALISMDPNVRPTLVSDFAAYKARLDRFFGKVNLVKVSDEDLQSLNPGKPVEDQVRELLAQANCALVVVTYGEGGSRAFTRSAEGRADIYSPPVFGDTVGAGDSLMAGILTILGEWGALTPAALAALPADKLSLMLRFGAVTAGINCGRAGCVPPTRAEVDAVLSKK